MRRTLGFVLAAVTSLAAANWLIEFVAAHISAPVVIAIGLTVVAAMFIAALNSDDMDVA